MLKAMHTLHSSSLYPESIEFCAIWLRLNWKNLFRLWRLLSFKTSTYLSGYMGVSKNQGPQCKPTMVGPRTPRKMDSRFIEAGIDAVYSASSTTAPTSWSSLKQCGLRSSPQKKGGPRLLGRVGRGVGCLDPFMAPFMRQYQYCLGSSLV